MRVSLILLLVTITASAQQPTLQKPANTAASEAAAEIKPVVVPIVVRDKKGNLVTNLTQADFTLQAASKPQTITAFEHESTLPTTLGVLIDVAPGQANALEEERTATAAFFNRMTAPNKAFLVQFAKNVELLEDVTDSHPKLQSGIQALSTVAPGPPTVQTTSTDPNNSENGHARAGSALYDAVFLSSDEITAKLPGRRVIVMITDGVDRNSKETIAGSIEAAQRADTILYAVYVRSQQKPDNRRDNNNPNNRTSYPGSPGGYPGSGYPGTGYPGSGYPGGTGRGQPGTGTPTSTTREPLEDGKKNLERMCGETGGRVFEVSKHQPLEMIYDEIAEELHAQYRLTFTPTTDITKDGYHLIDITLSPALTKAKATIQTRDGYFTTN